MRLLALPALVLLSVIVCAALAVLLADLIGG